MKTIVTRRLKRTDWILAELPETLFFTLVKDRPIKKMQKSLKLDKEKDTLDL